MCNCNLQDYSHIWPKDRSCLFVKRIHWHPLNTKQQKLKIWIECFIDILKEILNGWKERRKEWEVYARNWSHSIAVDKYMHRIDYIFHHSNTDHKHLQKEKKSIRSDRIQRVDLQILHTINSKTIGNDCCSSVNNENSGFRCERSQGFKRIVNNEIESERWCTIHIHWRITLSTKKESYNNRLCVRVCVCVWLKSIRKNKCDNKLPVENRYCLGKRCSRTDHQKHYFGILPCRILLFASIYYHLKQFKEKQKNTKYVHVSCYDKSVLT